MAYALSIGDLLDVLKLSGHPMASAYISEAESLAARMATTICETLDGVTWRGATFDMGSVQTVFEPASSRVELPGVLRGYDDPTEWGGA